MDLKLTNPYLNENLKKFNFDRQTEYDFYASLRNFGFDKEQKLAIIDLFFSNNDNFKKLTKFWF